MWETFLNDLEMHPGSGKTLEEQDIKLHLFETELKKQIEYEMQIYIFDEND